MERKNLISIYVWRIAIILVLFLFSLEIFGEDKKTQTDLRLANPFSVSYGYTATDYMAFAFLSLEYNLSRSFSVRGSLNNTQFYRNEKIAQNYFIRCPQFEGSTNSFSDQCSVYRSAGNLSFDFALDYYPFETPFYVSSHFGYLPDARAEVHIDKKNFGGYSTDSSIYYSAERKNTLFTSLGIGFKWMGFGLIGVGGYSESSFLKFEFGMVQTIYSERKVFYHVDERGLIEPNRNPDPSYLLLLNRNSSLDKDIRLPYISFGAGVTF